ncbi:MAG: dockerin type I repeat-containing protein, partial [Muribaculaceae bacterium]|nr:dockerin type I repeat-containing protein [Muribaculaceae bacterium]
EEKYQALSVGSMGWSGLGFASTGGEGKGKDLSMLDDSYRLHIAFKGNDTEHVTHAIGVGSAHFSLGLKPFNDNGKLYGLMGDFKRDGEWYCFDIPFDEIAMRANPVFANESNYIDNVISILSGGTAGVGLNFDAIFFYRDAKEQLMGDVNGDGVLDVKDVTGLINYILGTPPADFVLENANIDGEGEIDVQDVTALINMILD